MDDAATTADAAPANRSTGDRAPVKRTPKKQTPAKSTAGKSSAKTAAGKSPAKPAAGKSPAKPAAKTAAGKPAAKTAAEKAASSAETISQPLVKPAARTATVRPVPAPAAATVEGSDAAKPAAASSAAAESGSARPGSARTAAARAAAAKTAAPKSAVPKSASTAAAKSVAARSAAASKTTAKSSAARAGAAKAAAARTAAERTAASKSTAKTAAARTASAKTAAAKAAAARNAAAKALAESAAEAASAKPITEADEVTVARPGADVEIATLPDTQPAALAEPPIQELPPGDEDPSPGDTTAADLADPEPAADEAAFADSDDDRTRENPVVGGVTTAEAITPASAEPVAASEVLVDEPASPATGVEPASVDPVVADETASEPAPEPAPEPASSAAMSAAPESDVAAAPEAIRIRGLAKHFGDHRAVNGIDLTIPAGAFYGIVGPNGAGKTTTLSIVAGLLRADEGSVVVCGIDQAEKPLAAKRLMGVLPDRLRTFDRLTGRQLLYYYGLLRGLSSDVIEKRAADLARAFDLSDALSRVVSDYSAGMTKKIMLAGAMIHSPRVLVLDEPFEAVDPVSSAVILDILRAYVAHGGTVVLSSHGMDLVERVCSRVAIIVGGDVLAEGTIAEVRAGQTLESRFVELSGGIGEVEGLEWLHTFSD